MIFVVEQKRLNDFKECRCVKAKDLYSRLGHRQPNVDFETNDEPIPMNMRKLDSIEYLEKYDELMSREAGTDAESGGKNGSDTQSD